MRGARIVGLALAATLLGLPLGASAELPSFDLDYEAPAECPSEAAFASSVRERLGDPSATASDGRRLRIRVTIEGGSYRGALETVEPPSVRDLRGATCEDVTRALVVFTALALSPPDNPPPPPPLPALPIPVDGPRFAPLPPARLPELPAFQPTMPRAVSRFGFGFDVRAIAATGVAPGLSSGGAAGVRVVLGSRRLVRWLAQVGGLVTYREEGVDDGAFSFLWMAGRVDAGPELSFGGFSLGGGPVFRAGTLVVRARDLPMSVTYSGFWGDLGAFIRLGRRLSSALELSLVFEAGAPLKRRAFGIQGVDAPVHEIPPIVAMGSFGITIGR